MLIKLYHIGKENSENVLNVQKFIGEKIYEEDMASNKDFKITNKDRNSIISKIFEKHPVSKEDIKNITQQNLDNNYQVIDKYFDKYFTVNEEFKSTKYNYYIYNLLQKVLLIEQVIKHKEDVAMIFETANDRGKELESHEVLKGMLLGVLDVNIKEECNDIWNNALRTFFEVDENYKNVDDFFRTYLRAKFADTANQYKNFAGKYHRSLLSNSKVTKTLDRSRPDIIERFIREDFVFFYKVYLKVRKMAAESLDISIASNYANDQGQQTLLILSSLVYNDVNQDQKITLVARKFDQFYTISRLIGVGDNNKRQVLYYELNKTIRNKELNDISSSFDSVTLKYFNENGIPISSIEELFDYKYFRGASNDGRFTKYVLARVDHFLGELLNEQTFSKQESLHFISHSGTKPVNGFHIEHMYSNNDEIIAQFTDENGGPDEQQFYTQRQRLGALLLFKGNENLRTSNWIYERKMKSYQNSGFIWNRILTNSVNIASLKNCTHPIKELFKSYEPDENGLLPVEVIEERQHLLFQLIKEIYKD